MSILFIITYLPAIENFLNNFVWYMHSFSLSLQSLCTRLINRYECLCLQACWGACTNYCTGGIILELTPSRVNRSIGTSVTFSCSYHSSEELFIEFTEDPLTPAPPPSISYNDSFVRYEWGSKRLKTLVIHPLHRLVVCSVRNKEGMKVGEITSMIYQGSLKIISTCHQLDLLFYLIFFLYLSLSWIWLATIGFYYSSIYVNIIPINFQLVKFRYKL